MTDFPTYLMSTQHLVRLIFQELGLVITGTLPVFNKTNTGSKVDQRFSCHSFHVDPNFHIYFLDNVIVSHAFFYIIHAYSQIVS